MSETASGMKRVSDRKLGCLLKKLARQDVLIVSELSRLGRSLMQIMGILNFCMEKAVRIISVKENCEFGDNINSKVLAFAFGLSAEIERNLISQRTKEALNLRRVSGKTLGRPKGSYTAIMRLERHAEELLQCVNSGISKLEISRRFNVSRTTLNKFLGICGFV